MTLLLPALAVVFLVAGPARGADDDKPTVAKQKLKGIEQEIDSRKKVQHKIRGRLKTLGRDVDKLTGKLIKTAGTIQDQEVYLTRLEGEVGRLSSAEAQKSRRLETRVSQMSHSLAALERLSRQPTAVIVGRPQETVDAMRTAALLATVVPALRLKARALGQELDELAVMRRTLEGRRASLDESLVALATDQDRLDRLMKEKKRQQQAAAGDAAREAQKIAALVNRATDLKSLIARLEKEQASLSGAIVPPGALSITAARGRLPAPVRGSIIRRFHEADDSGFDSKGLYIATRTGAQVVAPFDGRVAFAGPFRHYGLLLIITHGGGYHTLLAGLTRIDAVVGQWLLTGEPVGQMGGEDADGGNTRPTLYMELRRKGRPINPQTWLALNGRKVNG